MNSKILLLALLVIIQLRCTEDNISPNQQVITSSTWITIKDSDGRPLQNASVTIGDQIGMTDIEGHYFFRNIQMHSTTYLKVEKGGFFKGSRNFYPASGKINYINIILLPQEEVGVFTASIRTKVNIDSKSSLTFSENSIVDESGIPFSGSVHVIAYPIHADDPKLSEKMPGNLVGLDINSNSVALGSFGMLAVELQTNNGSKLNIASGKTVEMRMQIPPDMLTTAPPTIPLWYFDEYVGIWKAEGQAIKEGNEYVGHVSHFTFWNCDERFDLLKWDASFVYENGLSAAGVEVCLTVKSLNTSRCDWTNDDGSISGEIPANEILLMEIKDPCGNVLVSKEIGPYGAEPSTYYSTLPQSIILTTTISGKAVDCNNKPVKHAYVKVYADELSYLFKIDNENGEFNHSFISCSGGQVTMSVIDVDRGMKSLPFTFESVTSIDAGSLIVCDTLDQYIRFRVKGFDKEYVFHILYVSIVDLMDYKSTNINSVDTIGMDGRFGVGFDGIKTGTYITSGGSRINLPNGEFGFVLNSIVEVTYYGGPGDFIKGSFTGQMNAGSNGAGGSGYSDFAGTFAVRRDP